MLDEEITSRAINLDSRAKHMLGLWEIRLVVMIRTENITERMPAKNTGICFLISKMIMENLRGNFRLVGSPVVNSRNWYVVEIKRIDIEITMQSTSHGEGHQ